MLAGKASENAISRRRFIRTAGLLSTGLVAPIVLRAGSARADYPERPVKIVVANTPGGPSDIMGRMLTAALEESTGRTFIVENRGGAGGNIGMAYVARAIPDGYTVLLATNAVSVNVGLYNEVPYNPERDFVAVSDLATSPNTFVVRSELPAKTMKDFVALARAHPEEYNVSTSPLGSSGQLQAEVLKIRENLTKLNEVVFKGGGEALQALLSGTVQLCSGALAPAIPHIKAGTLRCLAVTSETRWPELPDVPTMQQSGYERFVFPLDTVLLAPAKTPPDNVRWLETETLKVLSTPTMKQKLFEAGFQVRAKGAPEAWSRVTQEIGMFKSIIEQAGIKKL